MRQVGVFSTCLVDRMRREIGQRVVKLLERAGLRVHVPTEKRAVVNPAATRAT
jgi:Fe-S oxidoreductase